MGKPRVASVVCTVGTNEWRIDSDYIERSEQKWLFDGTNVFNSSRITKPMPEETKALLEKTSRLATVPFEQEKNFLGITVWPSRDGHPLGDPAVNIAWLAFCSGTYLKGEGRLVPLPLEQLRHTRDRFASTDKTEKFEDEFGLPRTVDLFLSKSLFLVSESDFDKEYSFGDRYTEWTKKTAEKLPEGAQMFHYAVSAHTNFLGWTLPMTFEFFQNGRSFEQNGDWFWRGTGKVKSIRTASKPAGLFDLSFRQTVVDWRFKDAVIYTWANNFLSPTNDPFLQKKFEERVAQMERVRKLRDEAPPDKK